MRPFTIGFLLYVVEAVVPYERLFRRDVGSEESGAEGRRYQVVTPPLSLPSLSRLPPPPLHPHHLPYHTPHQCSPLTLSSLLSTHASPLSALSPRAATRCFHPLLSFGCLSPSP